MIPELPDGLQGIFRAGRTLGPGGSGRVLFAVSDRDPGVRRLFEEGFG
ncbi:hypothetical protein ABZ635_24685 [Nocardiopsis sp. NPDC007018]